MQSGNLLVQKTSISKARLVIIDGLGDTVAVDWLDRIPYFARRKIERRWKRRDDLFGSVAVVGRQEILECLRKMCDALLQLELLERLCSQADEAFCIKVRGCIGKQLAQVLNSFAVEQVVFKTEPGSGLFFAHGAACCSFAVTS